jgi:excinuclease ABC subunit C
LEAKLIKQHQPKYNVRLKDDKRYLYIGITRETYPRVTLIRRPEKTDNLLDWFGPFPSASSVKEVLRILRRVFPFRSCRRLPSKPCLYYHLKLCPGVCIKKIPKEEYQNTIKQIRFFLNGKLRVLLSQMEKQMIKAAKSLDFEKAQRLKNRIKKIQHLLFVFQKSPQEEKVQKQLVLLRRLLVKYQNIDPLVIYRIEAYDVARLGNKIVVGSMIVFINGEPDPSEYRRFKIEDFRGDPQAIAKVVARRLKHQEWVYPQVILIDGGRPQVQAVFQVLKLKNLAESICLLGLAKKKEILVIPQINKEQILSWKTLSLSCSSPVLQLLQYARDEAHRFAQNYYKLLLKKSFLRKMRNIADTSVSNYVSNQKRQKQTK